MDAYSREDLKEFSAILSSRIKELSPFAPSTMTEGNNSLLSAMLDRPALKLFSPEVLVVYLGRSSPLLRTLFLDEEDLPRCAMYKGVSSVVAQWRMSKGKDPSTISSASPVD